MTKTILVGKTVVGAFQTSQGLVRCLRQLAPGCKPSIKRDYQPEAPAVPKRSSNETRQYIPGRITGIVTYNPATGVTKKITYLRPGQFRL